MLVQVAAMMLAAQAAGPTSPPPSPAPAAPQNPCADEAHHQFDFWVGKWDVYPTGKNRLIAHSLIESVYGGCGVRENWMPLKGTGGGSFSAWVPEKKAWRQTWIAAGGFADFTGGWNGKAMVIEGWLLEDDRVDISVHAKR